MSQMMTDTELATEGNVVASGFHERDQAIRCWRDLVDGCGIQDQLLADAAGMSKSYFSKVSSGQQGDLLGMIFEIGRTYPTLRRQFIAGLAEIEGADPVDLAVEQLTAAAIRFLRVRGVVLPARATRMATASMPERKRRSA